MLTNWFLMEMSLRVLAVVVGGELAEEVTRKVSMMTSMDVGVCKRRVEEVDEVGDPRLAVEWWTPLSWFSCGKGEAHLRNRNAAHSPHSRRRRAWFRAFLCSSPSLALAIFGPLGTTCCSPTFSALWWNSRPVPLRR